MYVSHFHRDKAPTIAKATIVKAGFKGVERPPYCPYLAPSDLRADSRVCRS